MVLEPIAVKEKSRELVFNFPFPPFLINRKVYCEKFCNVLTLYKHLKRHYDSDSNQNYHICFFCKLSNLMPFLLSHLNSKFDYKTFCSTNILCKETEN